MMSSEQEDWVRFHLKNRSRKNNIRVRISNLERMKNCMEEQRKPERHRPVRELVSWCLYLVAVFLVTFLLINYVGQRTRVIGSSMENTLSDGDNLIVDKISYRLHEPKRFDVVVFPYEYQKNTFYIKRVIGLPGETVWIEENGNILIDGIVLEEFYGREVIQEPGLAAEPVTLDKDEYFVLGDNRNDSSDSRMPDVGNIRREDIIGKAWVRIYPFDKIGLIKHR